MTRTPTLPHDPDAERGVLGSCILDNGIVSEIASWLEPEDFYLESNQLLFRAIKELSTQGAFDATLLAGWLADRKELKAVGGHLGISALEQFVISTGGAPELAARVYKKARARDAIRLAKQLEQGALNGGLEDSLAEVRDQLAQIHASIIEWDKTPIELIEPELEELPKFPCDVLPTWAEYAAGTIAECTQTPKCFAQMVILGVMAASLCGKLQVSPRAGWREPVTLYVIPALDTGETKSPVCSMAFQPYKQWAKEERQNAVAEARGIGDERVHWEHQRKQALKGLRDNKDDSAARKLLDEANLRLDEFAERPIPNYWGNDVTAEGLAKAINRNGGTYTVLDAEGTVFGAIAGRYQTGAPNIDIFLKAFSADAHVVSRSQSDSDIFLHWPLISMVITPQPFAIQNQLAGQGNEERGLLGRFLYSFPTPLAKRVPDPPGLHPNWYAGYQAQILRMCRLRKFKPQDDGPPFWTAKPTAKAEEIRCRFFDRMETRRRGEGDLIGIKSWMGKVDGIALRIAAILECADATQDDDWRWLENGISESAMGRAVKLIEEYLIPHACYAFRLMGATREKPTDRAKEVKEWLVRQDCNTVAWKDVYEAFRRKMSADVLGDTMKILEDHRYVTAVWPEDNKQKRGAPRKRPSAYRVNAAARVA